MNAELEEYLARKECNHLTDAEKNWLRTQVYTEDSDYPVGRVLSIALMKLNEQLSAERQVNFGFINWLYTY